MDDWPKQVTYDGLVVKCSHCGEDQFFSSDVLLNTLGLTLLGLEWANRSAEVHACASCGHLEWFARREPAS